MQYRLLGKMALFWEKFHAKGSSVAHLSYYSVDGMVGWSIASTSDLGGIFASALRALVNMLPQV